MASTFQHPRGTRAALNLLAAANGLLLGQIYLISDEDRLAIATAVNAYTAFLKEGEGGGPNEYFDHVWGEESGNFSASTQSGYQYSYGNGETGQHGGVTIHVPSGYTAEVVAMTFSAKGNSEGVIDLVVNSVPQGVNMAVDVTSTSSESFDLPSPISLSDGDTITFRTISVIAASDGNVATAVIKFTKT